MDRLRGLPPVLLVRALWLRLRGRVHFPREGLGEVVAGEAEDYCVFRRMVVEPLTSDMDPPGAVLDVQFRFKRFSTAANQRLSRIPMPFIAVQPGFRSKTWMVGVESGAFRGLYEWTSVEDAERYWDSFPMRIMKRRAAPDTLRRSIRPTAPRGGQR